MSPLQAYSSNTFGDFIRTDNGRNIFPPPRTGVQSTMTINRRRCTDQAGCGCGNDLEPVSWRTYQISMSNKAQVDPILMAYFYSQ